MLKRDSSCDAPVTALKILLRSPLLGAARSSHAIAPRKGGVTNDAVTSARTVRRSGMSLRATSQLMGAAAAQQIRLEETAMITVVTRGSRKSGSVKTWAKLPSVNAPL